MTIDLDARWTSKFILNHSFVSHPIHAFSNSNSWTSPSGQYSVRGYNIASALDLECGSDPGKMGVRICFPHFGLVAILHLVCI